MSTDLTITIKGGLVQSVVTNNPNLIGKEVTVVDYDSEGLDEEESTMICELPGKGKKPAYVNRIEIQASNIIILKE